MKRKTISKWVAVVLALALACGFAACSDDKKADSGATGNTTETAGGDAADASALGKLLLDAKIKDIDGKDFDVSANKGAALTVFNVWATWCSPCVDELPTIDKIAKEYESKNVRVIGIMADAIDLEGKADDLARKEGKTLLTAAKVSSPNIMPDKAMLNSLISDSSSMPTTYIVGPNGELVDKIVGALDYDGWKKAIEKALKS
ncbi:MAG: TlpA family protein disulfide reductase [Clostridiales Family XIII bacterium]|jgi:thiol-disulfide isomerase/thioredoxin|nr:TlpA family protein disulfide reductase [Clostridiales Family XIII bacterium]